LLSVRAQTHVDSIDDAQGRVLASRRTSSLPILAKNSELETTLGPMSLVGVKEKDEVDIRAVVKLLAAQLAQPSTRTAQGLRRRPAHAEP